MHKMRISTVALVGLLAAGGITVWASDMTLEGTVEGAKCAAKDANPASCYELKVGGKMYMLMTSTDKEKMELKKLSGKMAKVMGDVKGDHVMVKSVAMGMEKKK